MIDISTLLNVTFKTTKQKENPLLYTKARNEPFITFFFCVLFLVFCCVLKTISFFFCSFFFSLLMYIMSGQTLTISNCLYRLNFILFYFSFVFPFQIKFMLCFVLVFSFFYFHFLILFSNFMRKLLYLLNFKS